MGKKIGLSFKYNRSKISTPTLKKHVLLSSAAHTSSASDSTQTFISSQLHAEEFFQGMGIQVLTGHHYLGGFIGDREAEERWLADKVTGWAESMETLARVSRNHPQSSYAGLQKSLQQEWAFVQRVTPGINNAFGLVEKALRETFVPELSEVMGDGVLERGFTRLPIKQAGLALPDPTQTASENWTASCVITVHLVAALRGQVEFRTADHSACLREGRTAVQRRGQRQAEEALAETLEGDPFQHAR